MKGWLLITRPADDVEGLRTDFARHGLRLVAFPALVEEGCDDPAGWQAVREIAGATRWLVVTSPRAPRHLVEAARAHALWEVVSRLPVAAVGATSAAACREHGLGVELEGEAGAASLGEALAARLERGEVVVHATGREHRGELREVLAGAGISVLAVVVYAMREASAGELPELPAQLPRAVVLTSPRAARVYARACGRRYAAAPHYVLGPSSAAEVDRLGYPPVVLARANLDSIVEELCQTCS